MKRPTTAAPPEHHPGHLRAILGCLLALDGLAEVLQARDAGELPTAHAPPRKGEPSSPRGCSPGCEACSAEILARDAHALKWVMEHALGALEGEITGSLAGSLGELAEQVHGGPTFLPDAEEIAGAIFDLMTNDDDGGDADDEPQGEPDEPLLLAAR